MKNSLLIIISVFLLISSIKSWYLNTVLRSTNLWPMLVSHAGPVVEVGFLVAVVIRVVVVLPLVILHVDVVLVHVLSHVDLGEDILQLGVVMERDGREWVEVVGIDNLSLCHSCHLGILNSLIRLSLVRRVDAEVETNGDWVDKEVGAPAHAAESA